MDFLPFFFDLKGKACLIVGGGTIATRKARLLNKAHAKIVVLAPNIQVELEALAQASGGHCLYEEYSQVHLSGKVLVISATDIAAVNEVVAADCHARNLPVNVVDSPKLCSIVMPAIVDRDPLIIGITSGGEAPVLARRVRAELERTIPAEYGELGKLASKFRQQAKDAFPTEDLRRRFWESVLNGEIAEKVLNGDSEGAKAQLQKQIERQDVEEKGEVYLVGAGPGDPDLLTFKALRLMQKAEVVLYDRLVSPKILEMVRRDAERIYVGKQRSEHAVEQGQINDMLLSYAQQGRRTLRLKGGDPFIFGRGGEEIDLLAKHKIPFQVVPGVTAATGCACYAGIPLTHRDYSQSVRFITGHFKQGELSYPWHEFVSDQQTLVFYMGLMGLPLICESLIKAGKAPSTPIALIERGTLPEQRVHIGTLDTMAEQIQDKDIHAPTLIIIGEVVSLHSQLAWFNLNNAVEHT